MSDAGGPSLEKAARTVVPVALGALAALGGRALVRQLLLIRLRRAVASLNAGDPRPLLAGYADGAVLRFAGGDHRWAGEHRGRDAIERFLRDFARAGLQGEIVDLWLAGPPWALRLAARFDDRAHAPAGALLYTNRTVLVVRTRWGRIIEHEDFYEDTERIAVFDARLRALGIPPLA